MSNVPSVKAGLASAFERERDCSCAVVLIGFKRQGNLGLGYLAATLEHAGYRVEVVDFEESAAAVLEAVRRLDPVLVGFSLIFQFHIRRFESLARYLRAGGVDCHFTIGGHFPSLSPAETLRLMPQLNTVVSFEGELTLLELVDTLSLDSSWQAIEGIVYRDGDDVVHNHPRALLADLDELPFPHRTVDTRMILGRTSAQLIASRGCARTCSFCSIHMFYRLAPGKVVRTRRPAQVAREMRFLYDERGATIFLFQDDDFPIFGPVWHRWCRDLLEEIANQDLVGRVLWKINCRADAVDPVLLAEMRDAGLYLVYMGLESGSDEGLRTLHKQTTVAQNMRAVETLKELDILFDFGFMMLEPSSTFESIAGQRRVPPTDRRRRLRGCRVLPDGPVRWHTDQRRARAAGPAARGCLQPGLRFTRPALGNLLRTGQRGAQGNWLDPRSGGALTQLEVRSQRVRDHGTPDPHPSRTCRVPPRDSTSHQGEQRSLV